MDRPITNNLIKVTQEYRD